MADLFKTPNDYPPDHPYYGEMNKDLRNPPDHVTESFVKAMEPASSQDAQIIERLNKAPVKGVENPSPDETNPKDLIGAKKTPLRLLMPSLMVHLARVMELGAKKYGAWNWRSKKVRYSVYLEAAMRHLLQAMDGEDIDPESGQPHEAHIAACVGIILDAKMTGNLIDDRPKTNGLVTKIMQETDARKSQESKMSS